MDVEVLDVLSSLMGAEESISLAKGLLEVQSLGTGWGASVGANLWW